MRPLLIGLHVNCRQTQDRRRWDKFSELADKLIEAGCYCIFTGASGDREYVASVVGRVHQHKWCADLSGLFTLKQFILLLKSLDLFITVNTGVMHIAIASKVPTVAIVGGTPASVIAHRDNPRFKFLEDPGLVDYPHYKVRINEITVDEVYSKVREMLTR